MSKYALAKAGIETLLKDAESSGIGADDALLALLVTAVAAFADVAGREEARTALLYELDNLGGNVDTVFLRSR